MSPSGTLADRLAVGLAPLAALLLIAVYASHLGALPYWNWNPARMLPSMALASGHELYHGPDEGPMMTTYYGPVQPLLFMPVALGRTPTEVVLIGGVLNLLLFFGPLLLLQSGVRRHGERGVGAGAVVAGCVFVMAVPLLNKATHYIVLKPHVDATALGLALLSCWLLLENRSQRWRLPTAATLVVLATWAKQIEFPVALAQLIYLTMVEDRRTALRYTAYLAVAGIGVSATFIAIFGFDGILFNIFTLLSAHPRIGGLDWAFLVLVEQMISCSAFALIVLIAIRAHGGTSEAPRGVRALLRERPWGLFVLTALLMVPTSIPGRLKVFGGMNSYHSVYFLLAAATLILTRLELLGPSSADRRRSKWVLYALASATLVAVLPQIEWRYLTADPRDNPQEQAYRYALAHPGTAYFPWNPISTLMAEGRIDNFDYAIYERKIGGYPPTDALFRAYLPPALEYVMFHNNAMESRIMGYLPEFDQQITLPEMPGWVVFARGESR